MRLAAVLQCSDGRVRKRLRGIHLWLAEGDHTPTWFVRNDAIGLAWQGRARRPAASARHKTVPLNTNPWSTQAQLWRTSFAWGAKAEDQFRVARHPASIEL